MHNAMIVLDGARIGAQNVTPLVIDALQALRDAGGGRLCFTPGEYHFYKDGVYSAFYAVSNNAAGEKPIVFPILQVDGLEIDGGGATFVFHDIVFPFVIDGCKRVTLKNMILDRAQPPYAKMRVCSVSDRGFGLEIDRRESPFYVENGTLHFVREYGERSGLDRKYALHATKRIRERYLFTGECADSTENLPVAYMWGDAEERDWGVYLTYREGLGASPCLYEEGEELYVLLDADRTVDTIFLQNSEQIRIENITVRQGLGMGIIGQLCRNVTVKGFCTDPVGRENGVTICTDAMHFVNCDGRLEISECDISYTGDDGLNVHGVYTLLQSVTEKGIEVSLMHQEQRGFCPYKAGDRLHLIDRSTLDTVAVFCVHACQVMGERLDRILIEGAFEYGKEQAVSCESVLVENPDRMPHLHLHHNRFYHYPNLRLSGAGEMLVEDNLLECAKGGIQINDLWDYWYESGRVKHMVIRRNRLIGCNELGAQQSFLQIGVSGFGATDAPKIHGRIEITDNHFERLSRHAITACGVRELMLAGNRFDCEREDLILCDGKPIAAH